MFSKINTILDTIDAYVWGIPLIVLILSEIGRAHV